jgi:hypothetical protein
MFRFLPIILASNLLSTTPEPTKTDILFVLEHPGETKDLLLVTEELKRSGRNFSILALGTAKNLVDPSVYKKEIIPSDTAEVIASKISPKILITGVATEKQKEFLNRFENTETTTYAYWDNPEPNGSVAYFTEALKTEKAAKYVLLPSQYVADSPEFADRPTSTKLIVGKPTLEEFQKTVENIDQEEILGRLKSITKDSPILVFSGTYGKEYEKAFALFINCINKAYWDSQKKQVIFQIHPSSDGKFEKEYCEKHLGANVDYIISTRDVSQKLSIEEAIAISDLFITYNSSSNFQAAICGRKIANVIPDGDPYTTSLLKLDIAMKISSPESLVDSIQSMRTLEVDSIYRYMGIPKNSVQLIIQAIDQGLKNN